MTRCGRGGASWRNCAGVAEYGANDAAIVSAVARRGIHTVGKQIRDYLLNLAAACPDALNLGITLFDGNSSRLQPGSIQFHYTVYARAQVDQRRRLVFAIES